MVMIKLHLLTYYSIEDAQNVAIMLCMMFTVVDVLLIH
tara:strand:- start:589 stop:702 length:114 start_codon:yes stop_codon:yes gene_type:complete